MVNDLIIKIKEAEENAKIQIKEAQANSDKAIKDARDKTELIIEETKKQVAESKKLFMKNAEEEASQLVAQLREFNKSEREKIRNIAESNKSKVASFITGRIIG